MLINANQEKTIEVTGIKAAYQPYCDRGPVAIFDGMHVTLAYEKDRHCLHRWRKQLSIDWYGMDYKGVERKPRHKWKCDKEHSLTMCAQILRSIPLSDRPDYYNDILEEVENGLLSNRGNV